MGYLFSFLPLLFGSHTHFHSQMNIRRWNSKYFDINMILRARHKNRIKGIK